MTTPGASDAAAQRSPGTKQAQGARSCSSTDMRDLSLRLGKTELNLSTAVADCGILHESTASAEIVGLPVCWNLACEAGGVVEHLCTATMSCGHRFNVSALTLHFLSNSQRCPLCRNGVDDRLHIDSVPLVVRSDFEARLREMQDDSSDDASPAARHTSNVEPGLRISMDSTVFERDLHVTLWAWAGTEFVPVFERSVSNWERTQQEVHVTAPVLMTAMESPVTAGDGVRWRRCNLQRWWKRTLFGLEERRAPMQVRISLSHPLLDYTHCTSPIDVSTLLGVHTVRRRRLPQQDGAPAALMDEIARLEITELDAVLWINMVALRESIVGAVGRVLASSNWMLRRQIDGE